MGSGKGLAMAIVPKFILSQQDGKLWHLIPIYMKCLTALDDPMRGKEWPPWDRGRPARHPNANPRPRYPVSENIESGKAATLIPILMDDPLGVKKKSWRPYLVYVLIPILMDDPLGAAIRTGQENWELPVLIPILMDDPLGDMPELTFFS